MKYLLAVDGSVYSVTAYNHLVFNVLNKERDSLVILYAVDHNILDGLNNTMALSGSKVLPVSASQATLEADGVKLKYEEYCFKNQLKYEWVQVDGTPIDVIKNYINKHEVGTLVLGSQGKGVLKRAVLGSVSQYFVNHAKVPTLVVPTI